jgi:hypothetical protein
VKHSHVVTAEDLRRESESERSDRERRACADCGSLVVGERCPECGGTNVVTVAEIIDPAFRE